ncbi:MATE family efflux transporter [Candidatus Epulonipiscium fishelsonii]|uniref:MATE family efflux transporter n=1 Tax=Candidatus Epulonipiscium fishelsonii TaxID=77094 RepID=A0ACC8X9P7_9FIRM|nr:MATE family efflux transporter [Epulopiscium sp. SCG-B05WGA-EpuloA1]ONI38813.1 MATE family efflux transporter [Epulopiscium sp. SCG-B11WGA-EpuloA1]
MQRTRTDLDTGSVGKLLFQLSVPAIIAQLVNILYNIVDRVFLGRIENGEMAMAGVGVAFPIIILISAFSSLVGAGGAPLAAIQMGKQDNDKAEKIMTNSFISLIIIAIILTIVFMVFKEPILWLFGASEVTIKYSLEYLGIYLLGTVAVQISLGMNPFINTQGFARIGMSTVIIGAITNIILDPIFIFGFNMGVKGAALATIIAQSVSAIWVLKFLFGSKSRLKLRKEYLKPDFEIISKTISLGISPFIMQSTESLLLISLNSSLSKYGGDIAVSTMTIMSSIIQMITLPAAGIGQGGQPIISYNYGANNFDRVKKTFKLMLIGALGYTCFMGCLTTFFPSFFIAIFTSEPAVVEMAQWSIPLYLGGMFVYGGQLACQQSFLALGQAKISMFLALLRKIILLIPLIYILPMFFDDNSEKLKAVLWAEPIADILASLTTMTCFSIFYRKVLRKDKIAAPIEEPVEDHKLAV